MRPCLPGGIAYGTLVMGSENASPMISPWPLGSTCCADTTNAFPAAAHLRRGVEDIPSLRAWVTMNGRIEAGRKDGFHVLRGVFPAALGFKGADDSNTLAALRLPVLRRNRHQPDAPD